MPSVYSMELYASKCIFEITANGLFLFHKNAANGRSISYPLNTELIGKDNVVNITLLPTVLENGQISRLEDINISGTIKRYGEDDFTGPETGQLLTKIDFTDVITKSKALSFKITDPSKLFPLSKEFKFDNDELSFRNRLLEAPIIIDEKMLLAYAEKLRDIIARQDVEELYKEYKPKLDDYTIAYPKQFPDPKQWFIDFLKNDFFPGGPITDFKRDAIGLKSWCGGRIWEIFVKPEQEFFRNKGLDGDINTMELFVGMVDNSLKILR